MKKYKELQVYYDENKNELKLVTHQQHSSFGIWFYPAHGLIWLGDF